MIHVGLRTCFVGDSKFREGEVSALEDWRRGLGVSKEVCSIALIRRSTQGASESADVVDEQLGLL
jgi:hypothetical protein